MKRTHLLLVAVALSLTSLQAAGRPSVLFIGNSFTYGHGSPVRFYRADTVTDLNSLGIGGVPALFKSFAAEAGLDYDVFVETQPGSGLEFHLAERAGVIGRRPWDIVVMHGQSMLDNDKPGDPAKLVATARQMAEFMRARNPGVELHMTSTWSRADQTYPKNGHWFGKAIDVMARDVRAGYDAAAAGAKVKSVIPVGEAFNRAFTSGVADPNPYDGVDAGKMNLWTWDSYHASTSGYYLEALMVFGDVTGRDPRSLGDNECSAFELGLSTKEAHALQQVAFDELAVTNAVKPNPLVLPRPVEPQRCTAVR